MTRPDRPGKAPAPPSLPERYELGEALGSGGMGSVWLAHDRSRGEDVAVKVLASRHLETGQVVERFRREGEVAKRFLHPHILPVLDVGEHGGVPFLVSPFMPLGTLGDRVGEDGAFAPVAWAALAGALLDALGELHAGGVIHRDIKPSNILFDRARRPHLADFGVAHLAEAMRLTGTLELVGTPLFMAPECLLGEPADARSDLFSLGQTLLFAANGSTRSRVAPASWPSASHRWLGRLTARSVEGRWASVPEARQALADLMNRAHPLPGRTARQEAATGRGGASSAELFGDTLAPAPQERDD